MNLRKFGFALILALGLSSPLVLAQQGGGGGGGGGGGAGIPGPTGTGQCFISTASGAGNWIWGSCSGSSSLSFSSLTTGTNTSATLTIGSGATFNTIAGAVVDFSTVVPTAFKLPVLASATTSANGNIGYDPTNKNWHIWSNAVDNFIPLSPVSGTFNANDCVQIGASAPGVITFVDSGAGCGGGNVFNVSTPTAGQGAFWTDATHLQGINTTGSGNAVRATSPTFITPVLGAATATSINGLGITSSTGTLTVTNLKTLAVSNTLTFTGTDGSSVAFGTGGTATYTSNNLSVFAATTSAQLAGVLSDETGSGLAVFGTAPAISAPVITGNADASGATTFKLPVAAGFASAANGSIGYDTTNKNWHVFGNAVDNFAMVGPVSGTYTNGDCVKFSVVASVITLVDTGAGCGGAGVIGGSGTIGQTAEFVTNSTTLTSVPQTGSGNYVKATTPTLVTPVLGVASATSINKVTITAPATGSTLTVIDGKTATISNTLTFTGTDASSVAFGTGGTVTYTSNNLSVFAATTSAQLAGVLSDEITTGGSAKAVFAVALQGTDTSLLTSGTISASAGVGLCTDANHGATTSGCTATGNTTSTSLTTGFIPTANGANSIINSLLDDGVTTANTLSYSGAGGISTTGGGGAAGYVGIGQGTAQTVGTASVGLTAPTGVTAWNLVFAATAGSGYVKGSNASNIVTQSFEAAVDVSSGDITGVGTVPNGMTGRSSLTNHSVILGAGTSAVTQLGPVATGAVLLSQGASSDPIFTGNPVLQGAASTSGTLGLGGGTGGVATISPQASFTSYNFNLPTGAGTTGQPLLSGGGGSTAMTFATLGTGAGGTNATTPAAALINLFPAATRAGDMIYCATFSSGCTAWSLLPGNNSGTLFLSMNSSGVPSWASSAATVTLNQINAAAAGNTINNGDNAQVWNAALTTAGKSFFTFGENTAGTSTGTPYLVNIQTLATSTVNPLVVTAVGTANGIQVLKTGALTTKGTGGVDSNLLHCDVTDFTKCFLFVDSGITTGTTRNVTIANANSTTVVADTGAANNFLTAISASGVISKAQPSVASLSDGANVITDAGTLTTHGVAVGSGTKTITSTAAGTSGQPLLSGGAGADPAYGTLSVGAGGTALTSGTSGGVLGFTASGTIASSAALANKAVVIGGGAGATPTAISFPDVKTYPAANCVSTVAGSAWDTTLTPTCQAGTNNLGGYLPFVDTSTGQFDVEIPADWDTTQQPFIAVFFESGTNTTGTVIFNAATACTKSDGSVTSDPAYTTADALATKTMAAATRAWSSSIQATQVTSGNNCVAGGTMRTKFTRATDTAASAVRVTKATITFPRLLTVQAN